MTQELIRLSKRMVELGLCSRREADELIELGRVTVDGQVVDQLGSRVTLAQKVAVQAVKMQLHKQPDRVTLLMNKPVAYAAWPEADGEAWQTLLNTEHRDVSDRTGFVLLKKALPHLQVPCGLDSAAQGLLVLTQDTRLVRSLATELEQEYLLWFDGELSAESLKLMNSRTKFDGAVLKPYKITRQSDQQLRIVLRAAMPDFLPALCESVGIQVRSYKRIRIGRIGLSSLPEGQWRFLQSNERF
ncbi:pseudouridine synthase [Deefgea piscis]|uniref:pseudouridine synthase n=1 Tax=Deefgea piscis TaxID=2739061 RepID=UPI001C7FE23C|nr:S4 domain-containing protein [Deefgea piscis]QZA82432.1 pseudouridylate synthase [Deefgea piscis]